MHCTIILELRLSCFISIGYIIMQPMFMHLFGLLLYDDLGVTIVFVYLVPAYLFSGVRSIGEALSC
jgi:hypothetical protein